MPSDEIAFCVNTSPDGLRQHLHPGVVLQGLRHIDFPCVVVRVFEVVVPAEEFQGLRLAADDADADPDAARPLRELCRDLDAAVEGVRARRSRVVHPAVHLVVSPDRAHLVSAQAHFFRFRLLTKRRLYVVVFVLV